MTQAVLQSGRGARVRPAATSLRISLPWVRGAVAVAVPATLLGLHGLLYGRWIVDDAGITFAYARSVASGAGPVLQPGAAPVEGYSNPAWLAVLVAGRWLGLFDHGTWWGVPDYVTFPKAVALLCGAGVFAALLAAARSVTRWPALVAPVAGVLTAAVPSFGIWCFSGLENALLALAVTALAAVLVRAAAAGDLHRGSTAVACGLLAALAALTRPDGLVYALAYPCAAALLTRRGAHPRACAAVVIGRACAAVLVSLAAFAVPTGAYLVWRVRTFGAYLPNTAVAKDQSLPGWADVYRLAPLATDVGLPAVLLGLVLVGAGLVMASAPARRGLVALLVPLGLAIGAYAVLAPDWMREYRFATPIWPLGALAVTVAAAQVLPRLRVPGRSLVATVAVIAAVVSGTGFAADVRAFRAYPTAPLCLVTENSSRSFNGYAHALGIRGGTLLTPDIGGAALTSRLRIVDLAGLADARIARYWRDGDMRGLRDHVFRDVRPTFITSHSGWSTRTGLVADPRLGRDYLLVTRVVDGGNWVRRAAVGSGARLAAARAYAARVALPADTRLRKAPLSSCGNQLRS